MKKRNRGKMIVLEGIDGAGCGLARKLVSKALKERGFSVFDFKFPWYKSKIGKMIDGYLHEKNSISQRESFLLFFLNQLSESEKLKETIFRSDFIIVDRYYHSNAAYNCPSVIPIRFAESLAEKFHLFKPDMIVLIDVDEQVARKRKLSEEGKRILDRNEKDFSKNKKLLLRYRKLAKMNFFGKWKVVDGNKQKDRVVDNILKLILAQK